MMTSTTAAGSVAVSSSSSASMTHLQQKNSLNNASFEQQTSSQNLTHQSYNTMTSSQQATTKNSSQSSMSHSNTALMHQSSSVLQQTSTASVNAIQASTVSKETISNETVVQGQKFNISNALKKTSHHNSQDDLSSNRTRSRNVSGGQAGTTTTSVVTAASASTAHSVSTKRSRHASSSNGNVVGCALKGLDEALDALSKEQKAQEISATKYQSKSINVTENGEGVTSVTVSLPSSKRTSRVASRVTSRRGSIDLGQQPLKQRSRRNSIDLYTADYNIKLICDKTAAENERNNNQQNNIKQMKMIQKSSSHVRVDDMANSKLKFCPRCHSPRCNVNECKEFGDLHCPRCMEWACWEDSCWTIDDPEDMAQCETCLEYGHVSPVHEVMDFRQRRAIVDTLGWEHFQSWFYENSFRSWWQLNGLVGVPLYRIYQRKSDWKSGGPIEPATDPDSGDQPGSTNALSIVEKAAALAEKYSTQYKLQRDDSTDELLKSVHAQREARKKQLLASANKQNNNDDDSGRSTPEHLKKYSGSAAFNDNCNGTNTGSNSAQAAENSRRLRTFSETLTQNA